MKKLLDNIHTIICLVIWLVMLELPSVEDEMPRID